MNIGFALAETTSGTNKTMTEKVVTFSFGRRSIAAVRLELADKVCCGALQYSIYYQ